MEEKEKEDQEEGIDSDMVIPKSSAGHIKVTRPQTPKHLSTFMANNNAQLHTATHLRICAQ